MAAWLETPDHLIVDLRNIAAAEMAPLLEEETAAWSAALDWDFEPSAELVRRFVGMQALNGFALLEGERTIGYSYYIREEKKGLIGIGLFPLGPSSINSRKLLATLADIKGTKIRVLASPFQNELINRLGATPVAMTLADVMPALQQGAIDGALSTVPTFGTLRHYDVAKNMLEIGQPFVFTVSEISKKWFDALPKELQTIVTEEGDNATTAVLPWNLDFFEAQRKVWVEKGGTLTSLPAPEQTAMLDRISSIGADLSKSSPGLAAAYEAVQAAKARIK